VTLRIEVLGESIEKLLEETSTNGKKTNEEKNVRRETVWGAIEDKERGRR